MGSTQRNLIQYHKNNNIIVNSFYLYAVGTVATRSGYMVTESWSLFSEIRLGVVVSAVTIVLLTGIVTVAMTTTFCILWKRRTGDLHRRVVNYELKRNPSYCTTAAKRTTAVNQTTTLNWTTAVNLTTDAESDTHIYDEVGQGGANQLKETQSDLDIYTYIV